MMSAAVPSGYKQTEVGVIPENWSVKPLGEIGILSKGKGLLKEDIKTNGVVPAIPYTALYTDFSEVLDYGLIKWFVDDTTQTIVLNEPCVLIASSSNMAENTGKASALIGNMPVAIGREVIVFRTTNSASYISYLLSTSFYRKRTLVLARGTTIKHLYPATFVDYKISIPSLTEQRAIATALFDVDALLSAQDKLIAKKRDIKQAAMQQLLTGKQRLPGFSGEWEVKRLGKLLHFQVGCPFSSDYFNQKADGIRLVKNRDLKSDDQTFYYSGNFDDAFLVQSGDVLIGMDGDFLPCLWSKGEALLNQRVGRIVPHFGLDTSFAYYYLMEPLKAIEYETSCTTVKHLSHSDIENIELSMPELEEQTTIATVLTDMDADLAALEQQRDKTRALKQGMMQALLTGRIRLV